MNEDFNKFYNLINPRIKRNLEIVTPETLGQDFLLHIDVKTPSYFIPQMPRRASRTEDNTIPRVTVSSSILGCIIGYSSLGDDFFNNVKNGIYINKINFDYALKPNTKLVYDSDISDELWLVTYNKETYKFKPITVGKLFIDSLVYKRRHANSLIMDVVATIYIQIEEDNKLLFKSNLNEYFDKNRYLNKGFYKAVINMGNWNEDEMTITSITEADFLKVKNVSAALLSHQDNIPFFSNW